MRASGVVANRLTPAVMVVLGGLLAGCAARSGAPASGAAAPPPEQQARRVTIDLSDEPTFGTVVPRCRVRPPVTMTRAALKIALSATCNTHAGVFVQIARDDGVVVWNNHGKALDFPLGKTPIPYELEIGPDGSTASTLAMQASAVCVDGTPAVGSGPCRLASPMTAP